MNARTKTFNFPFRGTENHQAYVSTNVRKTLDTTRKKSVAPNIVFGESDLPTISPTAKAIGKTSKKKAWLLGPLGKPIHCLTHKTSKPFSSTKA